ncbi:hypothetical protein ACLOJK_039471 [Asimina triloba]
MRFCHTGMKEHGLQRRGSNRMTQIYPINYAFACCPARIDGLSNCVGAVVGAAGGIRRYVIVDPIAMLYIFMWSRQIRDQPFVADLLDDLDRSNGVSLVVVLAGN